MMNSEEIIENIFSKYYKDNPELLRIVLYHSRLVAGKALEIAKKKDLPLRSEDIFMAAMLHDIGVVNCNAPGIHAYGNLPYICHGIEGAKILKENNLGKYAGVCSRHTGSGLTASEIEAQNLPLPHIDLIPVTLLEKLICYADKFYSKGRNIEKEKTIEEIEAQMKKFGKGSLDRFKVLHNLFNLS